jgi:hypothetical protein
MPFACIPADAPAQPWIDTWGILEGGPHVAAAVDVRGQRDTLDRYEGAMDLLGAVLAADWDDEVDETTIAGAADRWGGDIREAADAVDKPLIIAGLRADHHDPDTAAAIVGAIRAVIDDAIADGVSIEAAFIEPGIAGPDSFPGLLDSGRAPTGSSHAFLDA